MAEKRVDFQRGDAITLKTPRNQGIIPTDGGDIEVQIKGVPGDVFSLTLEDSDGCNLLEKSPIHGTTLENVAIPETGVYTFTYKFPTCGSTSRYYVFKDGENEIKKIHQYPLSTITFTTSSDSSGTTNPQTLTLAGSDITSKGKVFEGPSGIPTMIKVWDRRSKTYKRQVSVRAGLKDISWTAAAAGGYSGKLYVSREPKNSDISRSTSYTKTTAKKVYNSTTIEFTKGTTNLEKGMLLTKIAPITKTMVKQPFATSCYDSTSIFELNDTKDLKKGMNISCSYTSGFYISSIDRGNKRITTNVNRYIKDNTELTFSYDSGDIIERVDDHHRITVDRKMNIPRNTDLTFDIADGSLINFDEPLYTTGSGGSTITITGKVIVEQFGDRSLTHTLNVDNFITNTPNAYDQFAEVTKDVMKTINLVLSDSDSNASSKTITIVKSPSHGSIGLVEGDARSRTYTPYTGYTGLDKFTFTAGDGVNTSAEKTISITVI